MTTDPKKRKRKGAGRVVRKHFALTESMEDYLETIQTLIDEDPHHHAHTRDIAGRLRIKMPSVSNALSLLCDNGYVEYEPNRPVTLTPLGAQEAARVIRRHRLLTAFLSDVLALGPERASGIACRIEHVIDEDLLDRLETLTGKILSDPCCAELRERLNEAFLGPAVPSEAESEDVK